MRTSNTYSPAWLAVSRTNSRQPGLLRLLSNYFQRGYSLVKSEQSEVPVEQRDLSRIGKPCSPRVEQSDLSID